MKKREQNRSSRAREVLGVFLMVVGFILLVGLNALFGYQNGTVWLVGLVLFVAGLLLAPLRVIDLARELIGF